MTSNERYTEEEGVLVRRLAGDGLTDGKIAEITGKSKSRVKRIRVRFAIASPYVPNPPEYQGPRLPPAELEYLRQLVGYRPGMLDEDDDDSPAVAHAD